MHSWTLTTGTDLKLQAVATFDSVAWLALSLKYKQGNVYHYGFIDLDYDNGVNNQRYLQTPAI